MIYKITGEAFGLLCVIAFVAYLQNDDFSIMEITKLIVAFLLHKVALNIECRYLLTKNKEVVT